MNSYDYFIHELEFIKTMNSYNHFIYEFICNEHMNSYAYEFIYMNSCNLRIHRNFSYMNSYFS